MAVGKLASSGRAFAVMHVLNAFDNRLPSTKFAQVALPELRQPVLDSPKLLLNPGEASLSQPSCIPDECSLENSSLASACAHCWLVQSDLIIV